MTEPLVATETIGHVFVITLQREERRNAVDRSLADALDAALNELDDNDDLWVGILAARGPVFSAGSDLASNGDYATERGGEYGIIRRERKKPLIAAVEGPALGGGFEIVLSCDLVVASTDTFFRLPEVAIGVLPTSAGLFRAPSVLPVNVAREMILTASPLPAERAWSLGIVNKLCEPGAALRTAREFAEQICENAPVSVQASLIAVNRIIGLHDERGWEQTDLALDRLRNSEDSKEGIAAFFEKRPPRWTGH